MVTPGEARQIALSFEGTREKPHFNRTAFTVNKKIFATLLEEDATLNLMFDTQHSLFFVRRIVMLFSRLQTNGD